MSGAAVAQPSSQAKGLWYCEFRLLLYSFRPWASFHYVVVFWGNIKHTLGSAATQPRSQGDSSSRGWSCPTYPASSLCPQSCPEPASSMKTVCWISSSPLYYLSSFFLASALLVVMMDDLEGRFNPPAFHFIAPCSTPSSRCLWNPAIPEESSFGIPV